MRTTNPNDVIAKITVSYNSGVGQNPNIMLLNISDEGAVADIAAIERIDILTPSNTLLDISLINISGDLGTAASNSTIEASQIRNISIGGDWFADVVIDDPLAGSSLPLNSVSIGGDWLNGSLYNNGEPINTVSVGGQIAGSVIRPVEIWSSSSVGTISADSITNARIGSQTNGFSGVSAVTSITTTNGDFVSAAPMTMASLGSMDINGDFDADITLNGAMPSASSLYRINDTFASTAAISLPANGLLGTILINTNNASGQFLGDIEVGSTSLAPNYTTLSSALGGGATGLAPYNFHQFTGPAPLDRQELSCNPHHLESFQVGDCGDLPSLDEVIIDHYGPIYAVRDTPQDTAPQFRVEFLTAIQPLPNGTPWADVTDLFMVDFTRTSDDNASTDK
jgi:hypothetical protein